MTPEKFAELIVEGDIEMIAEAVAGFNESERKKIWKGVAQVVEEFHTAWNLPSIVKADTPVLDALRTRLGNRYQPNPWACELAVLAVGPLSAARKVGGHGDHAKIAAFAKVLSDRRPKWIDRWVESRLSMRFLSGYDWYLIRPLIRQGICQKPLSDDYIRLMASAAIYRSQDDPRLFSQVILEDPDALEDVWRLFEVETFALRIPEDFKPTEEREAWPVALARLAYQGHIDRQRLLDASLKALSTGFKNETLTYYMRFYRFLEPTLDETVSRQQTFFDLLANPASHVVAFALDYIGQIELAGRLDGKAFLAAMPPVFHVRSKGQSKTALKIADRLIRNKPELLPHAVAGVLEAFSHPAVEVQQQAVALIEAWADRLHTDHATTIRERLGELSPSVRSRAEKVVSQLRPAAAQPTEQKTDDAFALKFDELAREAGVLPSPWRERAGVDEALESVRAGGMPRPLEFDLLETRLLTGIEPIRPIQNVDELIDTVAHGIETLYSADELERILDGISRLCDERPSDFHRRIDPMIKRLMDKHNMTDGIGRAISWDNVSESMYRLLTVWADKVSPVSRNISVAIHKFFDDRVQEVIQNLEAGHPQPLLAAPTHQGGWIDAMVFVQRLTKLYQTDNEPGKYDLIQALLRLAPDNRDEALTAAKEIPGYVGRAVRWCLGGKEGPIPEDDGHVSLWLAAGRSRCPIGTLGELPNLKIAGNQPDAFLSARYSWRPNSNESKRQWWLLGFSAIEITIEPAAPLDGIVSTLPTTALHQRDERNERFPLWQCGFFPKMDLIAQVWPLCLDPFLVGAIPTLAQRLDMPSSTLAPKQECFKPWFEPDRPWSELAIVAIWIGLVSKDPGSRTAALDVLIQAIIDGRACPRKMSDVLLRMLPGYWVKLNRVAEALAEVARLSTAHSWFAAETLQNIVAGLEEVPRDTHLILALLNELLIDLGMALAPETRCRLEIIQGTSKTAKMANALRKLESKFPSIKLRQAGLQILEARVARAKRWSSRP